MRLIVLFLQSGFQTNTINTLFYEITKTGFCNSDSFGN